MAKKDMVPAKVVVDNAFDCTKIDEELITKRLNKSIDDLKIDLKSIDKYYDERFNKLHTEKKTLYLEWIKDKKKRREFLEDLIVKESRPKKKEELLREWFKTNSEIDALCVEEKNYLESCEIKTIEEKAKREKIELSLQIAKAVVPLAIKAILFGLNQIALHNSTSTIGNSTPIIKK